MLLGKRPRPPMRRTTSLTEISFDVGAVDNTQPAQPAPGHPQQQRHQRPAHGVDGSGYARRQQQQQAKPATQQHLYHGGQQQYQYQHMQVPPEGLDTRYLMTLVSPRNHQRNSGDFSVEPAHFLRACGLCKRRLGPGRDTYMYRGEVAFCSLECRQQQMNQDERKEKCSLTSMKDPQQAVAAGADAGVDGDTVAAA